MDKNYLDDFRFFDVFGGMPLDVGAVLILFANPNGIESF
jgi:hypothetical protein